MENQSTAPPGSAAKAVRQALGLRQAEMARVLGISKSYYCMIESGERLATSALLLQLNELNQAVAGESATTPSERQWLEEQQRDRQRMVEDLEKELRYRLARALRELKQLQEKHSAAIRKWRGVHALLASDLRSPKQTALLEALAYDCDKELKRYSSVRLTDLELKAEGLRGQLALIEATRRGGPLSSPSVNT